MCAFLPGLGNKHLPPSCVGWGDTVMVPSLRRVSLQGKYWLRKLDRTQADKIQRQLKGHEIIARTTKSVRKVILGGRKDGRKDRREGEREERRKRGWLKLNSSNQEPNRVVQWVKTLATKSDDMSSIPGTHRWKERTDVWNLCSDLYMCTMVCFRPYTQIHTETDKISK